MSYGIVCVNIVSMAIFAILVIVGGLEEKERMLDALSSSQFGFQSFEISRLEMLYGVIHQDWMRSCFISILLINWKKVL